MENKLKILEEDLLYQPITTIKYPLLMKISNKAYSTIKMNEGKQLVQKSFKMNKKQLKVRGNEQELLKKIDNSKNIKEKYILNSELQIKSMKQIKKIYKRKDFINKIGIEQKRKKRFQLGKSLNGIKNQVINNQDYKNQKQHQKILSQFGIVRSFTKNQQCLLKLKKILEPILKQNGALQDIKNINQFEEILAVVNT